MSIMDQVKKNLREWYSLAADRTGDMAKISVRMYDKYGISREIERQLSELGSYVYHAVEEGRTDFAGDDEFRTWYDRIKTLEHELEAKVDEIEEIRRQRQERQTAREEAMDEAGTADASPESSAPGAGAEPGGPGEPRGEAWEEPEPASGPAAAEDEPERREPRQAEDDEVIELPAEPESTAPDTDDEIRDRQER